MMRKYLFLLFLLLTTNVYADRFREISDVTEKLVIVRTPAYSIQSLAANTTTVDVSIAPIVVTGINAAQTDITGFDNAATGNTLIFVGNKNAAGNYTRLIDGGSFSLSGNWTGMPNHTIEILVRGQNDYVELGRSSN